MESKVVFTFTRDSSLGPYWDCHARAGDYEVQEFTEDPEKFFEMNTGLFREADLGKLGVTSGVLYYLSLADEYVQRLSEEDLRVLRALRDALGPEVDIDTHG